MSEEQVDLRIFLSHNPSPYWWAKELKDQCTPRTANFQDIFQMCRDRVFEFDRRNMRTLDIRLTSKKYMVKFEAYDAFETTHLQ